MDEVELELPDPKVERAGGADDGLKDEPPDDEAPALAGFIKSPRREGGGS